MNQHSLPAACHNVLRAPEMLAVLVLFALIVDTRQLQNLSARLKRQGYYFVCGLYPNQFYSIYPCNYNQPASAQYCANGGLNLGVGCNYDYQCTPFYIGVTACVFGCCCTKPTTETTTTTPADMSAYGYCYNGERSQMRCSSSSVCSSGQTCINGLCCKTTGNEWQNACAGLAALASCTNGICGEFICTTSNYCCECEFGRSSGLCSKVIGLSGQCVSFTDANIRERSKKRKDEIKEKKQRLSGCGPGFTCSDNGYCCPSCPSGETPYGSCYNGMCALGYSCRAGNICCS